MWQIKLTDTFKDWLRAQDANLKCAGDKTGDKQFYERMISLADDAFTRHLDEMKRKDK